MELRMAIQIIDNFLEKNNFMVIKNAYKLKGELFCSKGCKATYVSDMQLSSSW